jgi:methionyl-tRNA synthetase
MVKGPALWPRSEAAAESRATAATEIVAAPTGAGRAGPAPHARTTEETPVDETAAATPSTPASDERLDIAEFMRVELRVAKVLEAEAVPKSKKLIRLRVDVGSEERTIVAGIAEGYAPEQLVGRSIVIVANLKPAKLMGIESNGMVLAASPDGPPSLLAVDAAIPPGTRVR